VTPEEHRALGIELYNGTWQLLDGPDLDDALDMAHASAYHWRHAAGATVANRARSQWLCSRVHAVSGQPEGALHHARRCLSLVETNPAEMEDWDLAGAYEALARAHLAAGEPDEARRFHELGCTALETIADPKDRKHIEADLDSLAL
jgi:hypothetical protein